MNQFRIWTSAWLQLLFWVACEAAVAPPSRHVSVKQKCPKSHAPSHGHSWSLAAFHCLLQSRVYNVVLTAWRSFWERLRMTKYKHLCLILTPKNSLEWQWRQPFRIWSVLSKRCGSCWLKTQLKRSCAQMQTKHCNCLKLLKMSSPPFPVLFWDSGG